MLRNAEMIVFWSNDPDTTRGTYSGQESAIWRTWLKEKGVQVVFIDPFHNYTNAIFEDAKWIAPRMGTDTALAMAIAYVWITEDTYDKEYVASRTIGFDEFSPYVLGETDGVPKTPEWAAEESGVEARVIRTLAREWAAKPTALAAGARGGEGSACRTAYATEWARMMVLLQAMQGLGKPGITIGGVSMGAPAEFDTWFPAYAEPQGRMSHSTKAAKYIPQNPTKQRLYRLTVPDAILDGHVEWHGAGFCGQSIEQQFEHFVYPAEGCSEVKLWYRYGGSFMGTMSDTTKWVRMYQSPKLEFVVNQDIWFNSETRMADVILPACTNFERDDLGEFAACNGYTTNSHSGNNYRVIVREKKCIEPLWESRSDYQILAAVAERLGLYDEFTDGGKTELDWARAFYDVSDLAKTVDWETFDEKGYHIINAPEDYEPRPCLRWFAEGRACDTPDVNNPKRNVPGKEHELGTYSGKIEFSSESLKSFAPDDPERPVSPAVHRELGGSPHDRALREVPAAAHVAAPALLVPLPLRQAHRLAGRHPRPPHQEGRLRVVAGAAQPGRRGGARRPQRRPRPPVQRSRLGALLRRGHGARQAGCDPQLRVVRQVRPARAGQVRLVPTRAAASTCSPRRA